MSLVLIFFIRKTHDTSCIWQKCVQDVESELWVVDTLNIHQFILILGFWNLTLLLQLCTSVDIFGITSDLHLLEDRLFINCLVLFSLKPEATNETMLSLVHCFSWVPKFSEVSSSAFGICSYGSAVNTQNRAGSYASNSSRAAFSLHICMSNFYCWLKNRSKRVHSVRRKISSILEKVLHRIEDRPWYVI